MQAFRPNPIVRDAWNTASPISLLRILPWKRILPLSSPAPHRSACPVFWTNFTVRPPII